jgi:hypothetical protein
MFEYDVIAAMLVDVCKAAFVGGINMAAMSLLIFYFL